MYSNVVLEVDSHNFEEIIEDYKDRHGHTLDTDLSAPTTGARSSSTTRRKVEEMTGKPFPQDPRDQLWGAIGAVFGSWMNARAITYRRLNDIPAEWGTAVNVQAMVFGNMGETSAPPASPSPAIPRPARRSSTASSSSTRRARTSSPASARRRTSPRSRARRRAPTGRRSRRSCRRCSSSSSRRRNCWRSTTATCRTSSSPSSAASSGCCRPATASAPAAPRCGSPSRWRTKG